MTTPDPWATGPLYDLLQDLRAVLATYREQGAQAQADALLLAFAQEHHQHLGWVRRASPWKEGDGAAYGGRSGDEDWWRVEVLPLKTNHTLRNVCHVWRIDDRWMAGRTGYRRIEPTLSFPTREAAMRQADEWASADDWIFDPALPPEALAQDEGQREEPQDEGQRCPHGYVSGVGCFFCGRATYAYHAWSSTINLLTDGDWQRCERCDVSRRRAWNPKRQKEELTYWREGQRLKTAGACTPAQVSTEGA